MTSVEDLMFGQVGGFVIDFKGFVIKKTNYRYEIKDESGWEHSEFERLYVCLRTTQHWSQNFSERGVGSGWRRGGMDEDIHVCEDQGWYCLVDLVGDYLLVYFLLDCDITSGSSEGYSGGCLSVPDGIFLTEKLCKVTGPDGCYFCSIPVSIRGYQYL